MDRESESLWIILFRIKELEGQKVENEATNSVDSYKYSKRDVSRAVIFLVLTLTP